MLADVALFVRRPWNTLNNIHGRFTSPINIMLSHLSGWFIMVYKGRIYIYLWHIILSQIVISRLRTSRISRVLQRRRSPGYISCAVRAENNNVSRFSQIRIPNLTKRIIMEHCCRRFVISRRLWSDLDANIYCRSRIKPWCFLK